jgi:uncharacterized protein YcbX
MRAPGLAARRLIVVRDGVRLMHTLDRITIYPVKSLDGMDVEEARVLPIGALENDRRWRLVDMEGRVVNAKRSPLFHAIRAEFALGPVVAAGSGDGPRAGQAASERLVTLWIDPAVIAAGQLPDVAKLRHLRRESFHLVPGPDGPCEWLSEALGMSVLLEERLDGGFPDDRDAPGPTLVSTASLVEVARWFGFDLAEARRRFRVNLEIGGCDAFWEDTLASPAGERPGLPPGEPREFSIGDVRFVATNVCKRCVVPSRDSRMGLVSSHFRDAFEARRGRSLRRDVDAPHWNDFYRLAVNTAPGRPGVKCEGGAIRIGSVLAIASIRPGS